MNYGKIYTKLTLTVAENYQLMSDGKGHFNPHISLGLDDFIIYYKLLSIVLIIDILREQTYRYIFCK